MEDFNSETDSDYTSYWRDWVSATVCICILLSLDLVYMTYLIFLYFWYCLSTTAISKEQCIVLSSLHGKEAGTTAGCYRSRKSGISGSLQSSDDSIAILSSCWLPPVLAFDFIVTNCCSSFFHLEICCILVASLECIPYSPP